MIRVTKYFVILLHLGYVSSYDLYVFALCAEAFGQDLPKSKLQLKFPLKKGPISADTSLEELFVLQ